MRLLSRMAINSSLLDSIFLWSLCTCHLLKMTMKHGTSGLSSKACWRILNLLFLGQSWKEDFSVTMSCNETALTMQENWILSSKGKQWVFCSMFECFAEISRTDQIRRFGSRAFLSVLESIVNSIMHLSSSAWLQLGDEKWSRWVRYVGNVDTLFDLSDSVAEAHHFYGSLIYSYNAPFLDPICIWETDS